MGAPKSSGGPLGTVTAQMGRVTARLPAYVGEEALVTSGALAEVVALADFVP